MDVTTAVAQRTSTRAFLDYPVSDELLGDLLAKAGRSPSGGNVQPWRLYVVNGSSTERLLAQVEGQPGEPTEYDIYPPKLWEPYRTARFRLGEQMYDLLGIARDDREARLARLAENYRLFGAPAALFCFLDRRMGPPQWSDCGMFLQTFMLLAAEAGLATCAQESWNAYPQTVARFVGAPEQEMLFCGMAVGYADPGDPVNSLRSERLPLEEWVHWV